jgi:hypothetical protein
MPYRCFKSVRILKTIKYIVKWKILGWNEPITQRRVRA